MQGLRQFDAGQWIDRTLTLKTWLDSLAAVGLRKERELSAQTVEPGYQKGSLLQSLINNLMPSTRGGVRLASRYWNQYFADERPGFNTNPNNFLVEMVKGRLPGKALDVAMGQGRNGIWLAQQGWDVTGFDIAVQATTCANQQAANLGVTIRTEVNTIGAFDYGVRCWDLILVFYAGVGPSAEHIERALKPGGLLLVEAFHEDALRSIRICGVLFKTGELPARYPGLRTVRYEEPIAMPDFAQKPTRVVRFCAQKPESNESLIDIPSRLKLRWLRQEHRPKRPFANGGGITAA